MEVFLGLTYFLVMDDMPTFLTIPTFKCLTNSP